MKCRDVMRLLEAGHMDVEQRSKLEAHARTCGACNLLAAMRLSPPPRREASFAAIADAIAAHSLLPSGKRLGGHYTVIREVGRGGMGVVAEVRDESTGQHLALKATVGQDRATLERAKREFNVTRRLVHPGIVRVHHWFVEDDISYLVMDLVHGVTLREQIAKAHTPGVRVSAVSCVRLVVELLDALGQAHGEPHRLVHRDVKPENVMLCPVEDGATRLVVLDFGLVKPLSHCGYVTTMGRRMGTPAYAAPELLLGLEPDARADLFSSAMVLLELLAAVPAQTCRGDLARYRASAVKGMPEPAARRLDSLLDRALASESQARPQSAAAMAAELGEVVALLQVVGE